MAALHVRAGFRARLDTDIAGAARARASTGSTPPSSPTLLPLSPALSRRLAYSAAVSRVASTHDLVVCTSAGPAFLDQAALAALASKVNPGGAVEVREIVWRASPDDAAKWTAVRALRDADGLRKAMLYAGLAPSATSAVEPFSAAGVTPAALAAALYPELAKAAATSGEAADALVALASQLVPQLGVCVLRGTKPAAQAFSLKSRAPIAVPIAAPSAEPPKPPASAWAALDGASSNDLLDEDDLLEEDDLAKKEAQEMDCGTSGPGGKRKACKNCSCGLREMLEDEDAAAGDEPPVAKSACGNCGKGDAFRCASCPHRGKPMFEPGDELKLSGTEISGDAAAAAISGAPAQALGGGKAPAVGGVVKLSLDDTMDF